ncbi:hypothetical protein GW777_06815 [Candidatus Peregrinibacteria bacterium]|nr:hypothetical protein [Candidatus Parcubacteria bacterium]NCS68064.1 hypothetical protein [Candidatus Peregrinibacteria bacterium]PIX85805.1 MAG: hypothetical protein COZ32_06560 [Nitrospirae bacterium CG_4_10_14_3_um_filter_53_41]
MNAGMIVRPSAIFRKISRILYVRRSRRSYSGLRNVGRDLNLSVNNRARIFFTDSDINILKRYLQKTDLTTQKEELAQAEMLTRKKFYLLGHSFDFSGEDISWNQDPVTGKTWDDRFAFDIVYRGQERLSDIKLPWELAKMQYLFILGKVYCLTGDDKYSSDILAHMRSWIDNNPPFKGIHWISALEAGMRVISFVMAYPFILEKIEPSFLRDYLNSIYTQTNFVENNLSESQYANTHLIGEAFCLVLVGLFLDSPNSKKWYSKGFRILSEQISRQVYPDGVDKEQSLNYQRFFLDYYYLFIILHRQNNLPYPKVIDEYVEKMTEFLMHSLMPGAAAPAFGDGDDARGIYIKETCVDDYQSLLALGAVLFDRPDFKFLSGTLPEEIPWLLGEEGVKKYHQIKAVPPKKISAGFPQGGYYIMGDGWDPDGHYLIFDCGPLGHGGAGHGHADALSFQLCAHGFNYFVDPGTYSYNLDYEWRDYFRSTAEHNTITVDGLNQSEIKDRMSWKTFAHCKCNLWLTTDLFDIVDGEHDGYLRLDDPVKHRRIIFFNKKGNWTIIDLLSGRETHTFDYHLHLHPDCTLSGDVSKYHFGIHAPENKRMDMTLLEVGPEKSIVEVFQGKEETGLGWYSKNYGSRVPTTTIRARKQTKGGTTFVSFLDASSTDARIRLEKKIDNALCWTVENPLSQTHETVFYSLDLINEIVLNDLVFNGRLFYIKRSSGELISFYAMDVKRFQLGENINISSKKVIWNITAFGNEYQITTPEEEIKHLRIDCRPPCRVVVNPVRE